MQKRASNRKKVPAARGAGREGKKRRTPTPAATRKAFFTPLEPDPVIEAYKKDIDRTLIRENLKLTVEERFRKLMALQKFHQELQRAGREARRGK